MRKTFLSLIIGVLLGCFYLIGVAFHQGYLSAFGISSDLFPQNINQYFTYAFTALSYKFFQSFNLFYFYVFFGFKISIIIFILFFILTFSICNLSLLKEKLKRDGREIKNRKKSEFNFRLPLTASFIITVGTVFTPAIIIILLTTAAIIPSHMVDVGEVRADKVISQYEGCELDEKVQHACYFLYEEDNIAMKGLLVASSSDYIALYNGKETHIYKIGDLSNIAIQASSNEE